MKKLILAILIIVLIIFFKTWSLSNELKQQYSKIEGLAKDIEKAEGNAKYLNKGVYDNNVKDFNITISKFPNNVLNNLFLNYEKIGKDGNSIE